MSLKTSYDRTAVRGQVTIEDVEHAFEDIKDWYLKK